MTLGKYASVNPVQLKSKTRIYLPSLVA